jgi:hypothetical protein
VVSLDTGMVSQEVSKRIRGWDNATIGSLELDMAYDDQKGAATVVSFPTL